MVTHLPPFLFSIAIPVLGVKGYPSIPRPEGRGLFLAQSEPCSRCFRPGSFAMMTKTTEGYRDMARPKKNTAPETTQATKTDTVMVALNRTTGITFPMPDGRKVLIEGNAASLRGKEKGVLPVGAFGLTRVNADDWAYIEKTYGPHMEIFKSGLIFAQARKADAVDEADERAELRNGLEPVDVENDPKAQTEPLQSKAGF